MLDIESHRFTRDGVEQAIEPQVFDLICLLAKNAGKLVTTDQLVEEIWGGRIVSDSAISARIAAARKAVGDDGKRQAIIRTVARRGIQFVADVDAGRQSAGSHSKPTETEKLRIRYATADDGAMLAYSMHSDGSPLLRSAYFPGHLEMEWNEPYERQRNDMLCENNTLIRYDHRGCGLSDPSLGSYNVEQSAGDMLAIIDCLGLERVAIHGISSGAMNAVQFAANYPDRVSKLVLEGGYVDGRVRRHQGSIGSDNEPILSMVREGWEMKGQAFIRGYISMYFPDAPRDLMENHAAIFQAAASIENASKVRDYNNRHSIAPLLEKVSVPTQIIHARDDNVHPLSEARKMAAGIADAELLVLDTANDMILPFDPCWDEYCDAVREFLDG